VAGWQVVLVAVLIAAGVGMGWLAARFPMSRRDRPPPGRPAAAAGAPARQPGGPDRPPPEPAPVPRRPVPRISPGGPVPAAAATPAYGPAWHPSEIFGDLARDRWRSGPGVALFVQLDVAELPGGAIRLRRRSVRATDEIADRILGRVHAVSGPDEPDPSWPPVTGEWMIPATGGAGSGGGPARLRDLLVQTGANPLPADVEATLSDYLREISRPPGPPARSAAPLLYVAALAIRVGTDSAAVRLACVRSVRRDSAATLAAALLDRDDGTPALMPRAPAPVHA
jgi:hypothetical protein